MFTKASRIILMAMTGLVLSSLALPVMLHCQNYPQCYFVDKVKIAMSSSLFGGSWSSDEACFISDATNPLIINRIDKSSDVWDDWGYHHEEESVMFTGSFVQLDSVFVVESPYFPDPSPYVSLRKSTITNDGYYLKDEFTVTNPWHPMSITIYYEYNPAMKLLSRVTKESSSQLSYTKELYTLDELGRRIETNISTSGDSVLWQPTEIITYQYVGEEFDADYTFEKHAPYKPYEIQLGYPIYLNDDYQIESFTCTSIQYPEYPMTYFMNYSIVDNTLEVLWAFIDIPSCFITCQWIEDRGSYYRYVHSSTVDVNDQLLPSPVRSSCYPNPCKEQAKIKLSSSPTREVQVKTYNIKGQLIKNETQAINISDKSLTWVAKDKNGSKLPVGVYLVQVSGEKEAVVVRIAVVN